MRNKQYTRLRKLYPRTWRIWYRMNRRCGNQQNYIDIKVCDRWNIDIAGSQGFIDFIEDMGPSEQKLEIDRINPVGDYEPGNCKWVTKSQNMFNTRKHLDGTYKYVSMARANGVNRQTYYSRLRRGWHPQDAATLTPSNSRYKSRLI